MKKEKTTAYRKPADGVFVILLTAVLTFIACSPVSYTHLTLPTNSLV